MIDKENLHREIVQAYMQGYEDGGWKAMSKFEQFYEQMCKTCTRAVQCHEECTECDEFRERLESEE